MILRAAGSAGFSGSGTMTARTWAGEYRVSRANASGRRPNDVPAALTSTAPALTIAQAWTKASWRETSRLIRLAILHTADLFMVNTSVLILYLYYTLKLNILSSIFHKKRHIFLFFLEKD
jgi:hypothetical protein